MQSHTNDKIIVKILQRPDLAPLVADWIWEAFWQHDGYTLEQTLEAVSGATSLSGPPQTFVLLVDGMPVGTASLDSKDLDERRDLTPWLASVFVIPKARGNGYVAHLVSAVELACRNASISTLWLHTHTAEQIYANVGWHTVDYFYHNGQRTALMQRNL